MFSLSAAYTLLNVWCCFMARLSESWTKKNKKKLPKKGQMTPRFQRHFLLLLVHNPALAFGQQTWWCHHCSKVDFSHQFRSKLSFLFFKNCAVSEFWRRCTVEKKMRIMLKTKQNKGHWFDSCCFPSVLKDVKFTRKQI